MIRITRNLARQLYTVFRRTLHVTARGLATPVLFQTGPDGLRIRAQTHEAAVEYHVAGTLDDDEIVAPLELLNDCKGTKHDEVQLETTGGGQVIAGWTDGIPQVVQYDPPTQVKRDPFPAIPETTAENAGRILPALHDAMEVADPGAVRYAMGNIQLDGKHGKIRATDGKQVLVHAGFTFPWDEQVLIPQRMVFGCKELPADRPVLIGRSEDWVTIQVGPWTFHLRIAKEGRFPAVDDHIQRPADAVASLRVSDADAGFLLKALKRLPSSDEYNQPVTVDLNGAAVIRAQPEDDKQPPTEITLSASSVSGEALCINTNRQYLARALKLGFREVLLYGPEAPALCHDDTRNFVWALLGKEEVIKPSQDAIRISSQGAKPNQTTTTQPHNTRNHKPMAQSKTPQNGNPESNGSKSEESCGIDAIIEHAEALKDSLRDSVTKTNELIALLKRNKKANRNVQTALATLRQLRSLEA